jgi:hypothetical protein
LKNIIFDILRFKDKIFKKLNFYKSVRIKKWEIKIIKTEVEKTTTKSQTLIFSGRER